MERVELEALLARVEAATSPGTYLDCDLHAALVAQIPKGYVRGSSSGSYIIAHHKIRGVWTEKVPAYTSDLNAIVGLVERERPGWGWELTHPTDGEYGSVRIWNRGVTTTLFAKGATDALALCAACLKALIAARGAA